MISTHKPVAWKNFFRASGFGVTSKPVSKVTPNPEFFRASGFSGPAVLQNRPGGVGLHHFGLLHGRGSRSGTILLVRLPCKSGWSCRHAAGEGGVGGPFSITLAHAILAVARVSPLALMVNHQADKSSWIPYRSVTMVHLLDLDHTHNFLCPLPNGQWRSSLPFFCTLIADDAY